MILMPFVILIVTSSIWPLLPGNHLSDFYLGQLELFRLVRTSRILSKLNHMEYSFCPHNYLEIHTDLAHIKFIAFYC